MSPFDTEQELESFSTAAEDVVRLLRAEAKSLGVRAASVSGWSALEHACHLTLANELVLRNLANLARGSGLLVVADAQQDERALEVLVRGTLPRGQSRSPRMVVPPSDVELETTREWAARFVEDLAAFRRGFDARATRARLFVPHQVLGPLDLAQWSRFGSMHTRHHLAIAHEALANAG